MSELVITPNFTRKTARFHGTVAAGEHADVRIVGAASVASETLRLRVVFFKKTLAVFPIVSGGSEAFTVDDTDLTCTINLNTVQAQKAFRRTPEMEVLVVLDDPVQHQLHFASTCLMRGWPQEADDNPVDLDGYSDFVADTNSAIAALQAGVAGNAEAIAAEQTARQNADAGLTAGISSVSEAVSTKADASALDEKQDAGDYATRTELGAGLAGKQDAGNYLTEHQSLAGLATTDQMNAALARKANTSDLADLATKDELEDEQAAREAADEQHEADISILESRADGHDEGIAHAEQHITNHALDDIRHVTEEDRLNIKAAVAELFAEKNYDLSTTDGFVEAFIDVVQTLGGEAHD